MNSHQILEREFLSLRAKIIELAASFDRMDRADGDVGDTEEMSLVHKGLDILTADQPNRAEQVQMLFSHRYKENWKKEHQLAPRH